MRGDRGGKRGISGYKAMKGEMGNWRLLLKSMGKSQYRTKRREEGKITVMIF